MSSRLVLASGSPRRKELLGLLGVEFEVVEPIFDEASIVEDEPSKLAAALALGKAFEVARRRLGATVIGGDTVVVIDGVILGKPADPADAKRMLRLLSGRKHRVITGVAVVSPFSSSCFSETSWVTFRELNDQEIEAYVLTGEPLDKAGAYAIQAGAKVFATQIEGELETIIGLPLTKLAHCLDALGFDTKKGQP